jgi:hypothetical protein
MDFTIQPKIFYSVCTGNASIFMPQLPGLNWVLAQDPDDVNTDANGRSANSSLQKSLETSLKRIASGKTGANDFGKTVRALEEGDKERRDGAQGLRQYPYELWGGMLVAFAACGVAIWILWRRGGGSTAEMTGLRIRLLALEDNLRAEAEDWKGRRGNTLERLTNLDGRMTVHEQTCMSALSNLESAVGDRPGRVGV